MDPIESFESVSPEADGEAELLKGFNFGLIPKAVIHDKEVAENIFARCAKKKMRADLGPRVGMMISHEGVMPHLTYHASVSITMEIPEKEEQSFEDMLSSELFKLTSRISNQILMCRQDKDKGGSLQPPRVLLVDSMSVQILEIGPRCYSFRLGQKWGIE